MRKFRKIRLIRPISPIRLIVFLLLAVVLAGAGFYFFTKPAVAAWFDENWLFRQAIPITAHTAAENNVYIVVTVDTNSTNFQAHCEDVRFTQADGKSLPYYLFTDLCRSGSSVFHVFLATFPAGAQTIYVYYGNPSAPKGGSSADFTTLASNYTVGTLATAEQSPGPVAYWKFDDGTGLTAKNSASTGSAVDGTLSGTTKPTWQTENQCISGKCLFFDGSTSYVDAGSAASINIGNTVTVEAWINTNSPTTQQEILGQNSTVNAMHIDIRDNGKIQVFIPTLSIAETSNVVIVSANTWYHVVYTRNGTGGTHKFYINGTSVPWTEGSEADYTANSNKLIGARTTAGVNAFKGFIDDVKIYPYARTAAQIKTDYNAGKAAAAAKSGTANSLGSKPQDWMSNGLVGYWKMDESSWSGTSADVLDASGNGNNGTASCAGVGCTKPIGGAAGKFGNAGSFDGAEDYVDAGEGGDKLDGMSSITVGAWLNPQSSTEDAIIAVGKGGSYPDQYSYTLNIDMPSGNLTLDLQNSLGVRINYDTGVTVPLNTWSHIVMTWDNANVRGYINGVAVGLPQALVGGVVKDSTANLWIGGFQYSTADKFKGSIDEVRIYNRALSPKEVRQLADWAPGPVGYWNFEEGLGGTVNDRSGYANTGTWAGTGAKHWDVGKIGTAGNFNGVDDGVNCGHGASLNITNEVSIAFWIKRSKNFLVDTKIIGKVTKWELTTWGANLVFITPPGTQQAVVFPWNLLILNKWHYVVITFKSSLTDTTYNQVYLDGVNVTTARAVGTLPATPTIDFQIGGTSGWADKYFNGFIDDVRIYNYVRTQKQVVEDMRAGNPSAGSGSTAGPVAYYKFDEGQGTAANNSGSGGSTLNGTIGTGTWSQSGKFGKALTFTASTSVTTTITDPTFSNSISLWLNPTTSAANKTLVTASKLTTDNSSNPVYGGCTGTALSLNTWTHLVAVSDGSGSCKIYQNGVQTASGTTGVTFGTSINIGASSFTGSIDEFKLYNYPLTADDVKTEYNHGQSIQLGALGTNSSYSSNSSNQEYCVPGDAASCVAPVGRWDFEEGKDNTCVSGVNDVCDTSGNGNDGAWSGTGAKHWDVGKIGKAGKFNGTDDRVAVTTSGAINTMSTVTAEAWVYSKQIKNYMEIINRNFYSNGGFSIRLSQSDGVFYVVYRAGGGTRQFTDGTVIPANTWTHVAFTYDGTTIKTYVNGKNTNSGAGFGLLDSTTNPIYIAYNTGDDVYYNGLIDQVRVFDYVRTPAQVAWDYNKGAPVAYWKFDECQGTTANDSSGNKNTGTITIGTGAGTGHIDAVGTCSTSGTAWGNGVTGKRNSSLNFDGIDDYVNGGVAPNIPTGNSDRTLEAWVKPLGSGVGSPGDNDTAIWMGTSLTRNVSAITIRTPARNFAMVFWADDLDVALTATNGQWYHIVGTYVGSTRLASLYVNGVLRGTKTLGGDLNTTANISIGSGTAPNRFFNGLIDNAKVYNYALTAQQIKNEYNGGAVNFSPLTGSP